MQQFSANMIFCIFEIMSICLNIIQGKYHRLALTLSIAQIRLVYKFVNFHLHQISKKTDLKFSKIFVLLPKFLVSFQNFCFPSKIYILVSFQNLCFPSKTFCFLSKSYILASFQNFCFPSKTFCFPSKIFRFLLKFLFSFQNLYFGFLLGFFFILKKSNIWL